MPANNPYSFSSGVMQQQLRMQQLLHQQHQLRLELQHTQQMANFLSTLSPNQEYEDEEEVIDFQQERLPGRSITSSASSFLAPNQRPLMLLPPPSSQRQILSNGPLRFRSKPVCRLICRYCCAPVCNRGMKAILLADSGVELFSTDSPPPTVGFIHEDYVTEKCMCRIRDVACLSCGNQVGYHVTQPCKACLNSCNNGHFWMFHKEHVKFFERTNASGSKSIFWAELPGAENDTELIQQKFDSQSR